jgi:hypothetical protein
VRCAHWAVGIPDGDGIRVALCERGRCGSLLPWRRDRGKLYEGPPQHPVPEDSFPLWLGVGVLSAAVLGTTGLVLWQAGTFDGPESRPTEFRFTGPSAQ